MPPTGRSGNEAPGELELMRIFSLLGVQIVRLSVLFRLAPSAVVFAPSSFERTEPLHTGASHTWHEPSYILSLMDNERMNEVL